MISLFMVIFGWVFEGCLERVFSMGRIGSGVALDCSEGLVIVLLIFCFYGEWGVG